MQDRCEHLADSVTFVEVMIEVSFHKHRAAVAGKWRLLIFSATGNFVQRAVQPLSLFFDETARPGGTYRVHDGKCDVAFPKCGKF